MIATSTELFHVIVGNQKPKVQIDMDVLPDANTEHGLKSIESLVARALLTGIARLPRYSSTPPIVMLNELGDRLDDFLSDYGAVGSILLDYKLSGDIESISKRYWQSRLVPVGMRLEDLVSAVLIALGTSIAANLLLNSGKNAYEHLKRRLRVDDERRLLTSIAKLEKERQAHLNSLLKLYQQRRGTWISDEDSIHELYDRTVDGGLPDGESIEDRKSTRRFEYIKKLIIDDVSRIESHYKRQAIVRSYPFLQSFSGSSFSDTFSLGRLVMARSTLRTWRDGAEAILENSELLRRLRTPENFGERFREYSKEFRKGGNKIVLLEDEDFRNARKTAWNALFTHASGFILLTGGYTSHCAVFARGTRKSCISVNNWNETDLQENDLLAIVGNEIRVLEREKQ